MAYFTYTICIILDISKKFLHFLCHTYNYKKYEKVFTFDVSYFYCNIIKSCFLFFGIIFIIILPTPKKDTDSIQKGFSTGRVHPQPLKFGKGCATPVLKIPKTREKGPFLG